MTDLAEEYERLAEKAALRGKQSDPPIGALDRKAPHPFGAPAKARSLDLDQIARPVYLVDYLEPSYSLLRWLANQRPNFFDSE